MKVPHKVIKIDNFKRIDKWNQINKIRKEWKDKIERVK